MDSASSLIANNNFLSLREWVELSRLVEEHQQFPIISSFENKRDAQLKYTTRALVVADVVLDKLLLERNHDSGLFVNISMDNIRLEMEADINMLRRMITSTPQQQQLSTSLEGIRGAELLTSSRDGSSYDDMSTIQRTGLILYSIFARGEDPPSTTEHDDDCEAEDVSTTRRTKIRDFEEYDEQVGPNKGRQKVHSVRAASKLKSLRRMNISSLESVLLQKNVPSVICTLILDMIIPPVEENTHFRSLLDVVAEVQQIMRKSELYFRRDFQYNNNVDSLHFCEEIIGRTAEVGMLLEAAASAQIDVESSHVCFIGGLAGVGKSFFVDSVKNPLTSNGWVFLGCKFDQLLQNHPLATIASAVDNFIQQLHARRELPDGFDVDAVVVSIEQSLTASGIVVLSDLVPSLRLLYRAIFEHVIIDDSDDELDHAEVERGTQNDTGDLIYEDGISSANTLRNRLHYLFGRLVGAISSDENPMLLFLDDVQWADSSSLELLRSLLLDGDHNDGNTQRLLVACAFRTNEVDETHILFRYVMQFEESPSVNVTSIHLDGVSKSSAHMMISEALLLPIRFTRELAHTLYAKSLGNPLFIKSLLLQLVDDNIIVYSLSKKRWVWDIRLVQSVSVDDNVAELMKYKLLRLPREVQDALKFISCFGAQLSNDIIDKYCSASGISYDAVTARLEQAVTESIISHQDQVYKFAHDMLQQAAYDLMTPEQKGKHHFSIGLRLMSSISTKESFDALHFTVIDQINTAKRYGVTESAMNISCARLNLQAGKRSMEISDFVSAWQYIVNGLDYLPNAKWEAPTYDLTLDLYEAGALACFVNVDIESLQKNLNAIFENALCFEDKIKAHYIKAQNLVSLNRFKEAKATVLFVLNELGESIPEEVGTEDVQRALVSSEQLLNGFSKDDIATVSLLEDEKKQWVVKLIVFLIPYVFMSSPRLLPLLANRIIAILLKYGACRETAFGISAHSLCVISIRQDIEAGYRYGKLALALLQSFDGTNGLQLMMKCLLQQFVNYLVEPIQSTASVLLESYEGLRATGDNEHACLTLNMYSLSTMMSGGPLTVFEKEIEEFALRSLRLHQLQYCRSISCCHNMVLALLEKTESKNAFSLLHSNGINSEDDLLEESLSSGRSSLTQIIYFNRMFVSFWLKKFVEAAEFATLYRGVGRTSMRFQDIYHSFYEGLTAYHFARCTTDESIKVKWMGVGETSIERFRVWQEHSTWNFENKLLLLQAEYHRCKGDSNDAESNYLAAAESARSHRFVHEEGLAKELYASFLSEKGDSAKSEAFLLQSIECYEKWGASAVVKLLKNQVGVSEKYRLGPSSS